MMKFVHCNDNISFSFLTLKWRLSCMLDMQCWQSKFNRDFCQRQPHPVFSKTCLLLWRKAKTFTLGWMFSSWGWERPRDPNMKKLPKALSSFWRSLHTAGHLHFKVLGPRDPRRVENRPAPIKVESPLVLIQGVGCDRWHPLFRIPSRKAFLQIISFVINTNHLVRVHWSVPLIKIFNLMVHFSTIDLFSDRKKNPLK